VEKSVIHRGGTEFGHSRMLLAGIQARPELDPQLRHSGVTPLGSQPHVPDTRPSCWGQPILPLSVLRASAVSIVHFLDWASSGCYVPHHDRR
jgi:hypothetical protein